MWLRLKFSSRRILFKFFSYSKIEILVFLTGSTEKLPYRHLNRSCSEIKKKAKSRITLRVEWKALDGFFSSILEIVVCFAVYMPCFCSFANCFDNSVRNDFGHFRLNFGYNSCRRRSQHTFLRARILCLFLFFLSLVPVRKFKNIKFI